MKSEYITKILQNIFLHNFHAIFGHIENKFYSESTCLHDTTALLVNKEFIVPLNPIKGKVFYSDLTKFTLQEFNTTIEDAELLRGLYSDYEFVIDCDNHIQKINSITNKFIFNTDDGEHGALMSTCIKMYLAIDPRIYTHIIEYIYVDELLPMVKRYAKKVIKASKDESTLYFIDHYREISAKFYEEKYAPQLLKLKLAN